MSWEAVGAISAILTAIIIAVSAAIALVQIRDLRKATQLQSFLQLMNELTTHLSTWTAYSERVLPERMADASYRRELADGRFDAERHPELILGSFWEKVGALIHFGLLEKDVFLDFAAYVCPHHWELLKDVAVARRENNPRAWERFELFAMMCVEHQAKRDKGA
jgi:hypothetical protein